MRPGDARILYWWQCKTWAFKIRLARQLVENCWSDRDWVFAVWSYECKASKFHIGIRLFGWQIERISWKRAGINDDNDPYHEQISRY